MWLWCPSSGKLRDLLWAIGPRCSFKMGNGVGFSTKFVENWQTHSDCLLWGNDCTLPVVETLDMMAFDCTGAFHRATNDCSPATSSRVTTAQYLSHWS